MQNKATQCRPNIVGPATAIKTQHDINQLKILRLFFPPDAGFRLGCLCSIQQQHPSCILPTCVELYPELEQTLPMHNSQDINPSPNIIEFQSQDFTEIVVEHALGIV